jgi:methyltransferase (TIGR00027 family)
MEASQETSPMILFAWLIYIPLQILWLPLSIIGGLWVAYKQIWISRKLGLSQTAVAVVNQRWIADVFGLRQDAPSRLLAEKLPNNSISCVRLLLFPLLAARAIAGKPILYPLLPDDNQVGLASMIFCRSARFDSLIAARVVDVAQFVVLGAGFDTRAYGPLSKQGLAMFELDQAANQRVKREAVTRAGLGGDDVNYIEVDFAQPQWINSLMESSYDPSLKSIFLWEGVTLYLSEPDVRATLAVIKANAAAGSVLLLDLYATRLAIASGGAAGKTLGATGEGLRFGLDFSGNPEGVLEDFAISAGFDLGRHFFLGSAHKKGAYMVVAEFVVRRRSVPAHLATPA